MKSVVNSFDIFDTLIARTVENPTDIFDIIEKTYPYPNFKNLRIEAQTLSNHTMDSIYENFQALTNEPDDCINKLREFELKTEMENTIPIMSNILKIKDEDIYVSDMYLSKDDIKKILTYHKVNITPKLFVSPAGKHNGEMWKKLNAMYTIKTHVGDNYFSDIEMALKNNITGIHTNIHKFSHLEKHLLRNGYFDLSKALRTFRLMNPYDENSKEYEIFDQQINYNIPILLFICNQLNGILIKENRDTVLFLTRDGCLIIKLFSYLFPKYTSKYFHSSRIINQNPNENYEQYVKDNYDDKRCILFDLHGSLESGRNLFLKLYGKLPRIYIFSLSKLENCYSDMTYFLHGSSRIEEFNQDYKGTLVNFNNNKDIRAPVENKLEWIDIMHQCIDLFIKNFKREHICSDFFIDSKFMSNYYRSIVDNVPQILPNQYEIDTLTALANQNKTDKGDAYACAHHYTLKYEELFSILLTEKIEKRDFTKFELLEIGLNRDNTNSIPSLNMWKRYFFNNINITGFDIDNAFQKFSEENINIITGDQSQEIDLIKLKTKAYDIIIDDGWHASKHQQISFKILWSSLKSGGFYVIEDLHYQPISESCIKTKELFKQWKLKNWIQTEYIFSNEIDKIKDEIESIDFFNSHSVLWGDSVENAFVYIKKKLNFSSY